MAEVVRFVTYGFSANSLIRWRRVRFSAAGMVVSASTALESAEDLVNRQVYRELPFIVTNQHRGCANMEMLIHARAGGEGTILFALRRQVQDVAEKNLVF